MSSCKRKRGPNWSEKEKVVLVDEYRRHRNILRPKGSTTSSVVEREKAWDEICAALKIVSGPYVKRDVVDVRKKWDNLCFWAKKCIAEWKDKHHTEGTNSASTKCGLLELCMDYTVNKSDSLGISTGKPVYSNRPRETKYVVFVDRWLVQQV